MNDPGDLSSDINSRLRIEQALRDVALGVTGATGQDIFQSITRHLATSLGVDFAFIGKLVKGPPPRIQTLAICSDGRCIDNMQYDLVGTPCQTVVGHMFRFIPCDICSSYPGDNMLSKMQFEGYAGYPLFDSQGAELGLIAVLHRRELENPDFIEAILKIFSVRAASELERLRVEEALRASEEHYRSIFNASVDGLLLCNPEGRIVDSNPAFGRMLGLSHQQLDGLEPSRLMPAGSEAAYRKFVDTASAGKTFHTETHALHRDGRSIAVEVHGVQVQYRDRPHLLAIVRDITERKQAEDERGRLEAQLRQAQKMEAIGHLTGGIAHDFNNILTGVMGYMVLAQERNETLQDERLGRYLERAQHSGQRARELIQQMLTFSRGQRGEPRALQLAPLIREAVKLLRATLPSSIEISTRLEPRLPVVMLDPVQVEQVMMNLCINARDAMQGSGRIKVRLSRVQHEGQSCAGCRQLVSGDFVEITVSDTGAGITPEVLERMFEPFYSTKEVGKGSGMGLSMVHGIVHEHGGHMLVESAPGQGAHFRVLFPALAETAEFVSADAGACADRDREPPITGRVLVVDDDEAASDFMHDLLENWHIEPTVMRDSPAALALFQQRPQAFDLAILDQTMPHMKGLELARRLHDLNPGLPVILYSGYSEGITQQEMTDAGISVQVQKPVDTRELQSIVRRLLTSAR
jgi:two-component system cell cycle sensor histidine kinase/response regulator CckA